MDSACFRRLLRSLKSLTPCQLRHLEHDIIQLQSAGGEQLDQRIEAAFAQHATCPHCQSEEIYRWGRDAGQRQRYRCRECQSTFNAFSCTPLSSLRHPQKWALYLEGVTHSQTLREAAKACGISLRTAFLWRHHFLALLEDDMSDQLQGIAEMDETFFRESFKGQKKPLPRPARKRGNAPVKKCKAIPVMVVRDRQGGHRDSILENMSEQAMQPCLEGHLKADIVVCADAHLSHESLASKLGFTLKELVTSAGQHVVDEIFHIQHINAWHSHLKRWIDGAFHGVATCYLKHYLGWRRLLTEPTRLTLQSLEAKIVGHWHFQQLRTT